MFIRKFYDAGNVEAGGEVAVAEQLSPAAAMAQFGSKSDETGRLPEPIEIKGTKEEAKTEVVAEAAIAKEEPKVEVKADEPKAEPIVEAKVEEKTAPIVQETPKQQTLDEVLKSNQPDTILKALGFDDQKATFVSELKDADPKLVGIMQAYKDGTLGDYIKELSVDYSQMSAEDVMRHQLRQEYPKASDKALEALFEQEIIERYKLDPDMYTDSEVEKGKLLLEAKADKYRDNLIANQEKFLLPKSPEPKATQSDNTAETQKQQIEAYRRELSETPYTKDIIANKTITIGEGTEAFKYPVDPSALLDILTDGTKWAETMYEKQGDQYVLKAEHQMMVAAFAQDSKKFLTEYAKHLKSIGAKEVIEPIENASSPNKSTSAKSDPLPTSAAAAMAKQGVRSGGGYS